MASTDSTQITPGATKIDYEAAGVTAALNDFSGRAWQIYNILAFMVEALPEDEIDALPIHCTLTDLRGMAEILATDLGNADVNLRRAVAA